MVIMDAQINVRQALWKGFPGGSVAKNLPASVGDMSSSLQFGRSPEKEMAIHSNILAWDIHGQRSLVDYSSWGRKRVRLSG